MWASWEDNLKLYLAYRGTAMTILFKIWNNKLTDYIPVDIAVTSLFTVWAFVSLPAAIIRICVSYIKISVLASRTMLIFWSIVFSVSSDIVIPFQSVSFFLVMFLKATSISTVLLPWFPTWLLPANCTYIMLYCPRQKPLILWIYSTSFICRLFRIYNYIA